MGDSVLKEKVCRVKHKPFTIDLVFAQKGSKLFQNGVKTNSGQVLHNTFLFQKCILKLKTKNHPGWKKKNKLVTKRFKEGYWKKRKAQHSVK